MNASSFESYPWRIVLVSNAVSWGIYGIGLYLMARLGVVWAALYAGYIIWMECRVLLGSCRSCYYFGKRCAFGKGRVCSWFFKKEPEHSLSAKQISWRQLVPDFLVPLIPLVGGIILLAQDFSWTVLLLMVVLVGLGSAGTGLVRSQLACKYCRQRELGCPAERLFSKTKNA